MVWDKKSTDRTDIFVDFATLLPLGDRLESIIEAKIFEGELPEPVEIDITGLGALTLEVRGGHNVLKTVTLPTDARLAQLWIDAGELAEANEIMVPETVAIVAAVPTRIAVWIEGGEPGQMYTFRVRARSKAGRERTAQDTIRIT